MVNVEQTLSVPGIGFAEIIAGQRSDTAEVGRKYTKRLMPI